MTWAWGGRVWGFLPSEFSICCLHSSAWLALQHLTCPQSTRKTAGCLERPLVASILTTTVTSTLRIGVLGAKVTRKGTL